MRAPPQFVLQGENQLHLLDKRIRHRVPSTKPPFFRFSHLALDRALPISQELTHRRFALECDEANDARRGFWTEPANQIIQGVLGTAIPIDFEMGSSSTRAQTLNDSNIATIVNFNGNRLWGARIASTAGKYIFLSTRRVMDSVIDSIQTSFGGAVMQPITRGFLTNVAENVNGFLRGLQSKRAIYGGNCWADGELNSGSAILQGKVFFNVSLTPVYPAESIQFTVELTGDFAIQV